MDSRYPLTLRDLQDALSREATKIVSRPRLEVDPPREYRKTQFGKRKAAPSKTVQRMVREAVEARTAYLPAPRQQSTGVYVIGAPDYAVKVGRASDPHERLKGIQTGCPCRLKVYAFVEVGEALAAKVERECHRRLSGHRKSGEWFDLDWREAVDMVRKVTGEVTAKAAVA